MNPKPDTRLLILIWELIAAGLLLAPSPRCWVQFGVRFSMIYNEMKSVLQPIVHFLIMAGGAFILMRLFPGQPAFIAVLSSLGIALLVALLFEVFQKALPKDFARSCDLHDLLPSFLGALTGSVPVSARVFASRLERSRVFPPLFPFSHRVKILKGQGYEVH